VDSSFSGRVSVKLGIVIIHYNTSADLDRCLESLAAYPPSTAHQVVVVDNASHDPGLAEVHRRYPNCRWLLNNENLGYAKGCNQGMAEIAADYYLILNPDIVVQPGALDRLLDFADSHPRAGMVGPQLLNSDGSVQHSCRRFYTFKTLLLRRTFLGRLFPRSETVRRHLMQDFDHLSSRPVDWVLGGCLLVRATAMARTGPMDERFFLYFEDVDWCYRMWQAGFEVQYAPDARFVHRHRRESADRKFSRSFWLHLGSLISFYEKWGILVWLLKKWRDPLLMFVLWLLDLAGLTVAFWAAYGLRALTGKMFSEPLYAPNEYLPLLVFSWLLASATFLLTGRYRPGGLRSGPAVGEHLRRIGVVGVLLLASTYLGHQEVISRAVLLMFIPLLGLATGLGAKVFHDLLHRLERGNLSLERTLLAGPPGSVQKWLDQARDMTEQGVDLAGYLADAGAGGGLPPLAGGDVPWLGAPADMLAVVRRYRISQVVFWDSPTVGDPGHEQDWRLLAALRRLRVRLRWQGGAAWLLVAGARPELFGDDLSAVQAVDSGSALRVAGGRVLAAVFGVLLGVAGLLPAMWLRVVRVPRGRARLVSLAAEDIWGHEARLTLAASPAGRILPLLWQWSLAGPLLRGKLSVVGPRPLITGRVDIPRTAADVLDFWRSEPCAPGLTGRWSTAGPWGPAAVKCALAQLWSDPGGFGELGGDMGDSEEDEGFRVGETVRQEASNTADPDQGGNFPGPDDHPEEGIHDEGR